MNLKFFQFLTIFAATLITSTQAFAYIGPGIAVVGAYSLLGPVAAVVTLILMLAYYPVMYFYKKHKKSKQEAAEGADTKEAVEAPKTEEKEA